MRVFITGGTGNIGQYVTKAFSEAGHECVVYTRTPGRVPGISQLCGVTEVKGHLDDFEAMSAAIKNCFSDGRIGKSRSEAIYLYEFHGCGRKYARRC